MQTSIQYEEIVNIGGKAYRMLDARYWFVSE
jgi:hypothetical protein